MRDLALVSLFTIRHTKTQLEAKSINTNNFTNWKRKNQISVTSVLKASSSICPPYVLLSVDPVESKEQILTLLKSKSHLEYSLVLPPLQARIPG